MKANDQNHLWRLKKNDDIYILDMGDIEKGFQKFKVIKKKHHKETYFSCSGEEEKEYWVIEFESPYLNRYITVYKENGYNATLSFIYAWQEEGKVKTKKVYLVITSDLTYGMAKALYEIENNIKTKEYEISTKVKQIEHLGYEVEFNKEEVVRLNEMLKKLKQLNETT